MSGTKNQPPKGKTGGGGKAKTAGNEVAAALKAAFSR